MYFYSSEAQVQFDHSQVTLDNMDHQVLFNLSLFIIKAKEGYLWNASQYPTSKSTNENIKVCSTIITQEGEN